MTKLFCYSSEDFFKIYVGYLPSQSKIILQHRTRIATRLTHHKNTGRENQKLIGLESMLHTYDAKKSQLLTS